MNIHEDYRAFALNKNLAFFVPLRAKEISFEYVRDRLQHRRGHRRYKRTADCRHKQGAGLVPVRKQKGYAIDFGGVVSLPPLNAQREWGK